MSDAPPFIIQAHLGDLESKFEKQAAKKVVGGAAAAKAAAAKGPERPAILDSKRQQNVGIALARFKEPISELKENVLNMDSSFFTMESVHKLISMVPTPEEVQAVQDAESTWNGPGPFCKSLSRVEEFVYEMSKVPRLRQRLQAVFVEMTFERQSEALQEQIALYEAAIRQLLNCAEWKQLLHLVLVAGNYLNTGNKRTGGAWGFECSTGLQKLSETRATSDPKFTLLHWVAQVVDTKLPHAFSLAERMHTLEEAGSINLSDLQADLNQLVKGCTLVEREVKACSGDTLGKPSDAPGAAQFLKAMKPFLYETAKPVADRMKAAMERVQTLANQLLELHGELPSKCTCSQLLNTAVQFCKMLAKAGEENKIRKVVDEKQKRASSDKKAKPGVADKLAATSKELEHKIKSDNLNKKLKNSFKKSSTRTKDSAGLLEQLKQKQAAKGISTA